VAAVDCSGPAAAEAPAKSAQSPASVVPVHPLGRRIFGWPAPAKYHLYRPDFLYFAFAARGLSAFPEAFLVSPEAVSVWRPAAPAAVFAY